jgi:hypothetical protein
MNTYLTLKALKLEMKMKKQKNAVRNTSSFTTPLRANISYHIISHFIKIDARLNKKKSKQTFTVREVKNKMESAAI